jgi:hypothetical protein
VILDISASASPGEVGRTDALPGFVYAVQVMGDYAHIADGVGGLRIVSVADKAQPARVASLRTAGSCNSVDMLDKSHGCNVGLVDPYRPEEGMYNDRF